MDDLQGLADLILSTRHQVAPLGPIDYISFTALNSSNVTNSKAAEPFVVKRSSSSHGDCQPVNALVPKATAQHAANALDDTRHLR